MDIGGPGSIQGLDIGEGGSYQTDTSGTTIVRAFSYDASAASGSRFTSLDITANNTMLGDNGDRLYIGSTNKFWAARCEIGVANTVSTETLLAFYWNGSLTVCGLMGVLKDSSTTLSDRIFEQTTENEYIAWGKEIDSDWVAVDNQLDAIPNTGTSLYWTCLQVPASGLTTPPRIDEIRVRGSDSDFATGTAHLVHWGKARVGIHFGVSTFIDRSSAQPVISDINPSANTTFPLFTLRNNQTDAVDATFRVPFGCDTSCKLEVTFDWHASATGECDFDLHYKFLTQGIVIGVGESDTASITGILITPSAANAFQSNDDLLTASQLIDISSLAPNDLIIFTLVRDGSSDANAGNVYPHDLIIHYTEWTLGELV